MFTEPSRPLMPIPALGTRQGQVQAGTAPKEPPLCRMNSWI
jgi:hypothetical protein